MIRTHLKEKKIIFRHFLNINRKKKKSKPKAETERKFESVSRCCQALYDGFSSSAWCPVARGHQNTPKPPAPASPSRCSSSGRVPWGCRWVMDLGFLGPGVALTLGLQMRSGMYPWSGRPEAISLLTLHRRVVSVSSV